MVNTKRFDLADTLLLHIRARGLPLPVREFVAIPGRKFRCDLAWPALKICCECDGGELMQGRHNRAQAVREAGRVRAESKAQLAAAMKMADAAEMLWVVLANVSGGDWKQQSPEWQEAAGRWRDHYFAALRAQSPNPDRRLPQPVWTVPANVTGYPFHHKETLMGDMGGLAFVSDTLQKLQEGVCPACGSTIPLARGRAFTCDEACHGKWIEALIAQFGETRPITSLETGKTHAVPTRVILEKGIKGSDLATYPEVEPS